MSGSKCFYYLLLMAIIAVFLLLALSPPYYLEVTDQSGEVLISLPLEKSERFMLCYEHSVHQTPVVEIFQVAPPGELCLVATEFSSFGVGTPFLPEEGELKEVDGKYLLEGLRRVFPEIRIRPLELTNNLLLYREQAYLLSDYTNNGSLAILKVRPGKLTKLLEIINKGGMTNEP